MIGKKRLMAVALWSAIASVAEVTVETVPGRWSVEKAKAWYAEQPWLVGCNYIPANAINQLEMWQAESFDPAIIKKELDLAQSIGFNTLRVYLHDVVWGADEQGLYTRMDQFLEMCSKRGIKPLLVFFDDCHHPFPVLGKQPLPVPEYHNSGWLNSPARDVATAYSQGKASEADKARLEGYVKKTMERFKNDDRVLAWELYNEPGRGRGLGGDMGSKKAKGAFGDASAKLLMDAWRWARSVNPSQPVMSCAEGSVGEKNIEIGKINSDVISWHSYNNGVIEKLCKEYAELGRPSLCTEYMARPSSTFQEALPTLKKYNVGAFNWGFVAGKTGCVYPWASRKGKNVDELREQGVVCETIEDMPYPKVWFHEIFYPDHTPFDPAEIECIKTHTGAK
ncbi:hypothetical protein PDESU_01897 [Pontiella desulfatans]|uniref:Glycoside hydrolase family 5 domain-containing protein n=1 Tax=Pontiella desulfatans TaxID=2750659 RepID=A0A6C2U176_PONDE|nr:cellulase family glycosylhydrolase [Pontiella desulfatans]VGO13341.1 hypothetical protein PDESU_01897 [Pontiella desulfatans]